MLFGLFANSYVFTYAAVLVLYPTPTIAITWAVLRLTQYAALAASSVVCSALDAGQRPVITYEGWERVPDQGAEL